MSFQWPPEQEDHQIPEISLNIISFDCLGRKFYCVLEKSQIPVMSRFFKTLETTDLCWEEVKEICMKELLNIEFPNLSKMTEELIKLRCTNSRSSYVFQQMESVTLVKDFILEITRERKLKKLLK